MFGNDKNAPVVRNNESAMPAFVQQDQTDYDVGITSDEIKIPSLRICQASTQAKMENENLREGHFYSDVTLTSFGNKIEFYLLGKFTAITWWNDEDGMLATKEIRTSGETWKGSKVDEIRNNPALEDAGKKQICYWVILKQDLQKAVAEGSIPDFYLWRIGGMGYKYTRAYNTQVLMAKKSKQAPFAKLSVAEYKGPEKNIKQGSSHQAHVNLTEEWVPNQESYDLLREMKKQIDLMEAPTDTSFGDGDSALG